MKGEETPKYVGYIKPNTDYHHGQLKPVLGASLIQVVSANRQFPEKADNTSTTYKHAPDLVYFNGKFYIQYLCTPKDEHIGPGISILASSEDGEKWDDFQVSFPEYRIPCCELEDYKKIHHSFDGNSYAHMHQRMSFYRSQNGVMLLLGFYGFSPEFWMTGWDNYGIGRVVRQLHEDGTLGDIYFIRPNYQAGWKDELLNYPLFTSAPDIRFIDACNELLNNSIVVQQWAEENGDIDPIIKIKHKSCSEKYEAFCTYPIDNDTFIGLWKKSYVTRSNDAGQTFGDIVFEPSLVMSGQKIWGEKVSEKEFVLAYVPNLESVRRWPLAVVFSQDGINFDNMRMLHGEVSPMRYKGIWKDFGPQYMRGISWYNKKDEDAPDRAYWYLTYSVNKEDIWFAKIPVQALLTERDTESGFETITHVYNPIDSSVKIGAKEIAVKDKALCDYCKTITYTGNVKSFHCRININKLTQESIYLELTDDKYQPAARIIFDNSEVVSSQTTAVVGFGQLDYGHELELLIQTDCKNYINEITVSDTVTGECFVRKERFYTAVDALAYLIIRTGPDRKYPNRDTDPEAVNDINIFNSNKDIKAFFKDISWERT